MLVAVRSGRFKRDVKRPQKRGKDMTKLRSILMLLLEEKPLPPQYRDHSQRGDWEGFRDLHGELQLARTGSHADLFRE
ncbi:type II toxin-antitoxin system YafQ family toxin [Aquibium sp. LZ166]|uniref:Type II toxin-antitoxin system YafQ family toxin n=1 Tax=Aquibium pacificus TaxID=3153579 RepID=A0ABV3SRL6_9HYPH